MYIQNKTFKIKTYTTANDAYVSTPEQTREDAMLCAVAGIVYTLGFSFIFSMLSVKTLSCACYVRYVR